MSIYLYNLIVKWSKNFQEIVPSTKLKGKAPVFKGSGGL